jgi:predicted nucleic acid-binding protein
MPRSNHSKPHELADAFAAALAKHKKAELVTADTESKPLEKEIKINWLK